MTELLEQPLRHRYDVEDLADPAGPERFDALTRPEPGAGPNAIEKALALLGALGTGRAAESLSGLAIRTSMPKSTVCRILKTMESQGFVARKGQLYCLGPRVLELGRQAGVSEHNDLRNLSLGVLEGLYADVRTTVHLAVPASSEVLLLEKITAPGSGRIPTRVGGTLPAACTAVGKALLAYADSRAVDGAMVSITPVLTPYTARSLPELTGRLRDVRRTGFAVDHEEFRPGITCVAAPVMVHGKAVASISASSTGTARDAHHTRAVMMAAQRLGAVLERSSQYAE
ncbi:IclR family transcriptional regulator [Streptomyces sp. NPDC002920]